VAFYKVTAYSYYSCNPELINENEFLAKKIANLQLQLETSLKEVLNLKHMFSSKDREIETLQREIAKITEEFARKIQILMLEIERLTDENARLRHIAKDLVVTDERDEVKTALGDDGRPMDTNTVTEIDIDYQRSHYIPLKFSETFRNLQRLTVHASELKMLRPHDLQGLVNLEILRLTGNELLKIEGDSFADLIKLELLDLSQNRIEDIDAGVFDTLINLKYLDLRENQLPILKPGLFAKLINLIELDLSYNPLVSIKSDIFPCPSQIQELRIAGSGLTFIDPIILACTSHLNAIDLSRNQCIDLKIEDVTRDPTKMLQLYSTVGLSCH
jgi:Leucine-rich repeat (LRR) protein